MPTDNICRIPVCATMRIIDGRPVMVEAEYADIPADTIARLLLNGFGLDAVPVSAAMQEAAG